MLASNGEPSNGKCASASCHWCGATDELAAGAAGAGVRYDPLCLVYVCEDEIRCLERLVLLPAAA